MQFRKVILQQTAFCWRQTVSCSDTTIRATIMFS